MGSTSIGAPSSLSFSSEQRVFFSHSLQRRKCAFARGHRRRGRRGVEERKKTRPANERGRSFFFFVVCLRRVCEREGGSAQRKKKFTPEERLIVSLFFLSFTSARRWSSQAPPAQHGEPSGRSRRARRGRARVGELKREERSFSTTQETPSIESPLSLHVRAILFVLLRACLSARSVRLSFTDGTEVT